MDAKVHEGFANLQEEGECLDEPGHEMRDKQDEKEQVKNISHSFSPE